MSIEFHHQPGSRRHDIQTIKTMIVCRECGDVIGRLPHPREPGQALVQRGTCSEHAKNESTSGGWSGFDLPRRVELCRCCGTVPLLSGSRFSVWFCRQCVDQIHLLNARFGRCVLPIGRHSVHAGLLLKAEDVDDPIAVHEFTERFAGLTDAHRTLEKWARVVIGRNFEEMGWGDRATVPVGSYARLTRLTLRPDRKFREMCAWLQEHGRASARSG